MALVNAVEIEQWSNLTSPGDTVERESDKIVVLREVLHLSQSGNWAVVHDLPFTDYFRVVNVPLKGATRHEGLGWEQALALVKELGD